MKKYSSYNFILSKWNIYLYLKEEDEKDEDEKNENDTLQGDPEACEDQIISLIGRTRRKPMFNGKKG